MKEGSRPNKYFPSTFNNVVMGTAAEQVQKIGEGPNNLGLIRLIRAEQEKKSDSLKDSRFLKWCTDNNCSPTKKKLKLFNNWLSSEPPSQGFDYLGEDS